MRESIFKASIRSLFVAFFAIIGICLGFVVFLLLTGSYSSTPSTEAEILYTPQIFPNAEGVRTKLSNDSPVILKLNMDGIIGTESLSMKTVRRQLVESREGTLKGDRVKAVLLYINTPGGTVVDADGIYHAIKWYKEQYKVPVYAYVDGICASGGMYVACAADKILSNDVSIIGSIGVISPSFMNVYQLLEKIGVQSMTLYAGKGKDDLNPLRPWKPGEEDNFKSLLNYYYGSFVDIVTSNRPEMNKDKLIKDYGASVYPAVQAKTLGYIDESGSSLHGALQLLAKKIGIEDQYYQVIELEKKTWLTEFFGTDLALFKGKVQHEVQLPPQLDPKFMNQFLYLYQP